MTSLRTIARDLQAGTRSAEGLAREAIANRERAAASLDAYTTFAPDTALAMASAADDAFARGEVLGRLQGIPVSIKDLFAADGLPTFAGSPRRLPEKFEIEGPIVAGLRRQGAVFTGKTHTSELGFGVCGHNVHWGTPRNPWDAERVRPSGGSSSGAAISIVEGSALLALGSDTGGSVREPANMTGIVGLKVTHGRWSGEGLVPPGPSLHGPGLLARTADDVAYAFGAVDEMCDAERLDRACAEADRGWLRIGMLDDFFWTECEPGIAEAAERALAELTRAGVRFGTAELPEARELQETSVEWDWGISAVELSEFIQSELPEWMATLHPGARRVLESREDLSAIEYLRRCRELARLRRSADATLRDFDVVVCPTSPMSPPLLDELFDPERYRQINRLAVRNMSVANLLDLCALTMPVGLDAAGMPVGLQLLARNRGEDALLVAACAFEKVLGTGPERIGTPPVMRAVQAKAGGDR